MKKPTRRHMLKALTCAVIAPASSIRHARAHSTESGLVNSINPKPLSFYQRWIASEERKKLAGPTETAEAILNKKREFYAAFSDRFYSELDKRYQLRSPTTIAETLGALRSAFVAANSSFRDSEKYGATPSLMLDGITRADDARIQFNPYLNLATVSAVADDVDVRRILLGKQQRYMSPVRLELRFDNGAGADINSRITSFGQDTPIELSTNIGNAGFSNKPASNFDSKSDLDFSDLFSGAEIVVGSSIKPPRNQMPTEKQGRSLARPGT
jgi:hypothetical protein